MINPLEIKEFNFTFEVTKVLFRNSKTKFMILTGKLSDINEDINIPKEITIQGTIPVAYKKDIFTGKGSVQTHNIYGRFIRLSETPKIILSQQNTVTMEFMRSRVKGLGIKKSKKIVDVLGPDAINLIHNDCNVLLKCGIKELEAKRIGDILSNEIHFEELTSFLQSIKIDTDIAIQIFDEFKGESVMKIRSNPYLLTKVANIDWLTSDRFAKSLNMKADFPHRLSHAILYYLNYHLYSLGDICVKKEDLINDFINGNFLSNHGSFQNQPFVERNIIESSLETWIEEKSIICTLNMNNEEYLYLPSYFYIEESIIHGLDNLLNSFINKFCDVSEIDDFLDRFQKQFQPLANKQKEAVYMALTNRISILTGGPGTGKTHTTNAIVKCIKDIKPNAFIKLIAPTGKAAKRLSEMTGLPASTTHRALGLKGFGNDEELTRLDYDFVLADESSMYDAYLFDLLINNIGSETRIIFVGDYHQLPSVGPGLILRDLINSSKISVTELDEIFRQASESQIVTNAHKMNKGLGINSLNGLTFDIANQDSYFVERNMPLQIQNDITETIKRFMNKGYKLEDFLVLSPKHSGLLGIDEINRIIQRQFNPHNSSHEITKQDGSILRVGDRVIQTENNYDVNVFNGEIGVIYDIYYRSDEGERKLFMQIEYPDRDNPIEFPEKNFKSLELAYCISIHKSQGSESPIVIMPIHETQGEMLDRTLIYTGYTRTKKTHIFIGSKDLLDICINKVDTNRRQSLIIEKLQKL